MRLCLASASAVPAPSPVSLSTFPPQGLCTPCVLSLECSPPRELCCASLLCVEPPSSTTSLRSAGTVLADSIELFPSPALPSLPNFPHGPWACPPHSLCGFLCCPALFVIVSPAKSMLHEGRAPPLVLPSVSQHPEPGPAQFPSSATPVCGRLLSSCGCLPLSWGSLWHPGDRGLFQLEVLRISAP